MFKKFIYLILISLATKIYGDFNRHKIVKRWTNDNQCGSSESSRALIAGGEFSSRGEWPFMVAIFRFDKGYEYICGGTILSVNHMLTGNYLLFKFCC